MKIEQILRYLSCPICRGDIRLLDQGLGCSACSTRFPVKNGIIDFVPEVAHVGGLAQRFMESGPIAGIYENVFRPLFTKIGSPITYDEEEAWLSKLETKSSVSTILDLACGTGRYARLLSRIYKPEFTFCVDISLPMLEIAKERAEAEGQTNAFFIRANAMALPFRDCKIDRINCFGALHLFPDPDQAISELGRISSDRALFSCLTAGTIRTPVGAAVQRAFSKIFSFRFFEKPLLGAALKKSGFKDVKFMDRRMVLMFNAVKSPVA